MTNKQTVLQEAESIINGDRRQQYGHPIVNFMRIAQLWEPILGTNVSAEQVALCMIQLKIARLVHKIDRDGMVDIAGYVGCLALLTGEDEV